MLIIYRSSETSFAHFDPFIPPLLHYFLDDVLQRLCDFGAEECRTRTDFRLFHLPDVLESPLND